MIIKSVTIVNYKNIEEAVIECSPGFNCFIGNNGVGKTNILDALYHLSMCRSYFNLPDAQNIRHGEPFFLLQGRYERDDEAIDIHCGLKRGERKVFKRNKKSYERLSDHIGLLPLVMISPADALLIDGGSEERRRFVDGVISQCDKEYLLRLIRYNRALAQRNSLLKACAGRGVDEEMMAAWDEQLAENGNVILQKREAFTRELETEFRLFHDQLVEGREQVALRYVATAPPGGLLAALRESLARDRLLTYTTVGIHRDDIALTLEGYPVKKLGSQGQKKSFLAALKFAQFTYLTRITGMKPLLLLDDVFDKLDAGRVSQIVQVVSGNRFGQVFITDTNREHIDEILRLHAVEFKIFRVDEQGVTPLLP
ncbi:MAG: DNA replication/repair protein RecF [Odoribacteraceae bacterium]|jgi:DNA replication and repair protein RecF|nr:DNA replication/repair protein RecF [Odoribacteraceae bacterium]